MEIKLINTRLVPIQIGLSKRLLLMIMKTFIFLLCTTVFSLTSEHMLSQEKVIINQDQLVTIDDVFKIIKRQTDYKFMYPKALFKDAPKVQLKKGEILVATLLKNALLSSNVNFELSNDNTIVIKQKPVSFRADLRDNKQMQGIQVLGKVTDEAGLPLPGATIIVNGTNIRMATNDAGEFQLDNVEEGLTITISYIGFVTQEIETKEGFVLIVMKTEVSLLNEVMILSTGYQVLSKERATGAFSKPDLEIYKNRTGTMDIVGRLEGLVAGLTITNSNNTEGEMYQTPIIRGKSSIELDMSPLYVVNGVIVTNINDINPNDISDITVLKDASAAAIWGAKAANGVIVITTSSGKKNQKLKATYSGFVNFAGKPDFSYNRLLSSKQYIQAAQETFNPDLNQFQFLSNAIITPAEMILYHHDMGLLTDAQKTASLDSLSGIDNMGQIKDLLFENAITTNQTFGLSGGGNNYSFYGSLSYTGIQSNRPGQKSNAYGINLSQEFTPTKSLRLGLTTALKSTQSNAKRPIPIQDQFLPYQRFRDANGNNISMPYLQGLVPETLADYQARSRINLDYVPLDELDYGYTKSNTTAINLIGNAWLKLLPGLSFHGTYGYSKSPTTGKSYDDHASYRLRRELLGLTEAASADVTPVYYLPTTGGTYMLSHTDQQNYTLRNQLEYLFNGRNGNDLLTLQVGQEANEQLSTFSSNRLYGYNEALGTYVQPDLAAIASITDPVDPMGGYFAGGNPYTESELKSRSNSYFALASYTLNQKYSLDASWRVDHSSLIGQDKSSQNRPIWSIGGRWQVKKEGFMENITWLDNLGLRTTYGITGNSPFVGAASSYNILSVQTGFFGATYVGGDALLLSSPANRKLNWESTETINFGIDFSVFKRIHGAINLYSKKTTDLLGPTKANPLTGYSEYRSNIGNLKNKGIELDLSSDNINGEDFGWSTGFVFAYNKNKLVNYTTPTAYELTANGRLSIPNVAGYPLNSVFAYRYAGLDAMGDPQIQLEDGTITKEQNVAQATDLVYMGSRDPKFSGGLSNTFRYKNLGLSINMIYNLGGVMNREVNTFFTGRLSINSRGAFEGNIPALFADRWKVPGDELLTDIPAYVADGDESYSRRDETYYQRADINVVSASYAKIRDITLSYSLPLSLLKALKIQDISITAQATNFMLWTANKDGLDPESQDLASGTRYLPPSNHSFSLGLNITF